MYRYQRLLVVLSLKDADASVLSMAARITRLAGSKDVIFYHAWQTLDVPATLREKYPWLSETGEGTIRERAQELIAKHYADAGPASTDTLVEQGSELGGILKLASSRDLDLIICGAGEPFHADTEKLARKAPCSVLAVPPESEVDFRKVLVPVDFSKYSANAVEVAVAFADAQGLTTFTCLHTFTVPPGHHRSSVPREEIARDLDECAQTRMAEFMRPLDVRGLEVERIITDQPSPAIAVRRLIDEESYDLVVVGARGKDAVAVTLLGSNALEILQSCEVPTVVVKEKGAGLSFLKSLIRG